VNPWKTKVNVYFTLSGSRIKHCIKVANRPFEHVAKFRYLERTLTDQNCMHEEIKSRLNSGNFATIRFKSLLSSRLLSWNKTIMLPVDLYGHGTWCLTLREQRRLTVFEIRVLRRIFGPKRVDVTGEW
jgi:hypothetical protein